MADERPIPAFLLPPADRIVVPIRRGGELAEVTLVSMRLVDARELRDWLVANVPDTDST